jgi:hypothetical protein
MENKSRINWLNIIFDNEFQNYLDSNTLKEVSILSNLVRLKLSSKLFKCIKLKERYNYSTENTARYYRIAALNELDRIISSAPKGLHKESQAELLLNGIKLELENFKRFVLSLYLKKLNFVGYQLFPLFMCFSNLSTLNLYDCTIPYSLFVNLGVSFPKLETIELVSLLLVKLPADNACQNEFIFPPNLSYLNISIIQVTEPGALHNTYDQLFDELESHDIYKFQLPIISIPSLKKLEFDNDYDRDCDLKAFLDINPNLETLVVKYFYVGKGYNFKTIKNLNIFRVYCVDTEAGFLIQEAVTELTIYIEESEYFNNISKLCLLCPNLERLRFTMMSIDNCQLAFDNFLIPILAKLPKLRTLQLDVNAFNNDVLDISKFQYVEDIVFTMIGPCVLDIKFVNCDSLKSIEFISNSYVKNDFMDEFKKLFQEINNWNFIYRKQSIKAYKQI